MDYDKIKCVTCKHCTREEFIPHGHSEYTPELGDWECKKGKFEPTGCMPDIAECEAYENERLGYQTYTVAHNEESNTVIDGATPHIQGIDGDDAKRGG